MIRTIRRIFIVCVVCTLTTLQVNVVLADNAPLGSPKKLAWVRARAEHGFIEQEIELAATYFAGRGVRQDFAQAAHWYEKAAKAGEPRAQNEIGYFYQAGIGVPVDLTQAAHWYQLAAASGLVQGSVNLGVLYLTGSGVEKNPSTAIKLFTNAFEHGCGTGASYLGEMYLYGMGVAKDEAAAEGWYEAGLKLHDPVAAYRLGLLYSVDENHPRDLSKAVKFLRTATEGGYVPAMHALGYQLVRNPELANSPKEARSLLEKAAESGVWRSSMLLGILARDGAEGKPDDETAYYYYQIALRQGGPEAQRLIVHDLKVLEGKLPTERRANLDLSADAWFAQHHLDLLLIHKDPSSYRYFPPVAVAVAPSGVYVGQLVPLTVN